MKLLTNATWGQLLLVLCALDFIVAYQQQVASFRYNDLKKGYGLYPYKMQSKSCKQHPFGAPCLLRMKVSTSDSTQDHFDYDNIGASSSFDVEDASGDCSFPSTSIQQTVTTASKEMKIRRNIRAVGVTLSALLACTWGLVVLSGEGAWRYYVSGGICAAISHAITTPIDVIKVCRLAMSTFVTYAIALLMKVILPTDQKAN